MVQRKLGRSPSHTALRVSQFPETSFFEVQTSHNIQTMSITYESILGEGRRRLKERGGLYALLAKALNGIPIPSVPFLFRPNDFTKAMEMKTNWVHDEQKLTMFAYVTPFFAYFCDSDGIYLYQQHEVRRVFMDPTFTIGFNADHNTPVVIQGDVVFTFRFGSLSDPNVQAAVHREPESSEVQTYLAMAQQHGANPTTLEECAKFPVSYGCTACGKVVFDRRMLKRCARCRVARYCNLECQAVDWKAHKKTCEAVE